MLYVKWVMRSGSSMSGGGPPETFTIPYGRWECWGWYMERIEEVTGVPVQLQRVVYAGCNRSGEPARQHSGLQHGATIHLIVRLCCRLSAHC